MPTKALQMKRFWNLPEQKTEFYSPSTADISFACINRIQCIQVLLFVRKTATMKHSLTASTTPCRFLMETLKINWFESTAQTSFDIL